MAVQQQQISVAKVDLVRSKKSAGEAPRGLSRNPSLKTHLENKSEKHLCDQNECWVSVCAYCQAVR